MKIITADPQTWDPLWCDPEIRDAYFAAVYGDGIPADIEEEYDSAAEGLSPAVEEGAQYAHLDELTLTVQKARSLAAEQDRSFHIALTRAADEPDMWAGPDPTLDPAWRDPRGRSNADVRRARLSLAVRAAAADIGLRVQLSENQVRMRAHRAGILISRLPRLWNACIDGNVSEQNMAIAADVAGSLPHDAPDAWATLDDALHEFAIRDTPARFRQRARAARERAHPESLDDRHRRALEDRRVTIAPEYDGMAEIVALVPAHAAAGLDARLDATARSLSAQPGETRTRAQLRTDVFIDLVTRTGDDAPAKIAAMVNLTIPALTLMGKGEDPAILDGYGPIPLEMAKTLAGDAKCWFRVLTDPFTGTVMDVERRSYAVPADLRRLLSLRYPTCIFPGCNRPSSDCDMDHRVRWADGGTTSAENLGPLCPQSHAIKDETLFRLVRDPDTGALRWISPSGVSSDLDPPPF